MRRALWDVRWQSDKRIKDVGKDLIIPYFEEELPEWAYWPKEHRFLVFLITYAISIPFCLWLFTFKGGGLIYATAFALINALTLPGAATDFALSRAKVHQRAGEVLDREMAATGPMLGLGDFTLAGAPKDDPYGPVATPAEHHVLALGPAGSGKTRRSIVPSVILHEGPVVSTSTRDDVFEPTAAQRRQFGRLWMFDPTGRMTVPKELGLVRRVRWSPLRSAIDWNEARKLAHQMVGATINAYGFDRRNAHFSDRAETLVGVLLYAAALGGKDMETVIGWATEFHAESVGDYRCPQDEIADWLAVPDADNGAMLALRSAAATGSDREQGDVLSTCARIFRAYHSDTALDSASAPYSFDPDAFILSTDTLYIALNPDDQTVMAPLIVGLIHDIIQACYRFREAHGRPVPNRVLFALDELANMAPLPDLQLYLTDGRANGITILAALQDLSQLESRWNPQMREQALTRFRTCLIFPGLSDKASLELLSLLIGNTTYYELARTRSNSRSWLTFGRQHSRATSEQPTRRAIVEPADLSAIPHGLAIARRDQEWGYIKTATADDYYTTLAKPAGYKNLIEILTDGATGLITDQAVSTEPHIDLTSEPGNWEPIEIEPGRQFDVPPSLVRKMRKAHGGPDLDFPHYFAEWLEANRKEPSRES